MTDKVWNATFGNYNNPSDWLPPGVPKAGDTAFVIAGTCQITNQNVQVVPLFLGDHTLQGAQIDLKNATVGDVGLSAAPAPSGDVVGIELIDVSGRATFAGTVTDSFGAGHQLTIDVAPHATMINNGTFSLLGTAELLDIAGGKGSVLINRGLIQLDGAPASLTIDPNVLGHGTIEFGSAEPSVSPNTAEFGGAVGAHQTFMFDNSSLSNLLLDIDIAREFKGTIADFARPDTIELDNVTTTSDSFTNGTLRLFNGGLPVASLHFAGSHTSSDFVVSNSGGNTLINHS